MSIQTLLLGALALAPAAINAAPTATNAINDCINLRIHGWYLVGECLTGQDATTRIESSVLLHNIVTTKNDILQWGQDSKGIKRCEKCTVDSDLVLTCRCSELTYPAFGTVSSLKLSEHINVYSGFLLQDFKGPPKPPATVSSIKIPADNSYQIRQGGTTCFHPTKPEVCKNSPVQDAGKCSSSHTLISGAGEPLQCYSYYNPAYLNYPDSYFIFEYMAVSAVTPAAWEFLYYDNLECKGEPMRVATGSELNDNCLRFSDKLVYAFTAKPLWNADY
ncbi:hypothetical protein DM02DRAFT_698540 [Periconia macrospinosa]|uniref:Cyanovirin-N domain-containing protein n=1 Tax=Periconia macrospinosa TaxID=97972 RepID=A0A2V1DYR8_9PLEO|nr:hypothetical protein DM02DRAFT_698540 [Periconia macrospinosa]